MARAPLTAEEAAQVLKISKYTLYELVKKGEIKASRVGRQLRIDPDGLERYLQGAGAATCLPREEEDEPSSHGEELRFVGSHEPAVELLLEFVRHGGTAMKVSAHYGGSMEGLLALYKRRANLAGVHLWDEQTDEYNLPFVHYVLPGEQVAVVNLVRRVQGWIVPPGNPWGIRNWQDLGREGLRLINRQKGSGTRLRLDAFLRQAGLDAREIRGYNLEEQTHFGVAYQVAKGAADAGIGIRAMAEQFGLGFVPLFEERYDLVCLPELVRTRLWEQVLAVLQDPVFRGMLSRQAGYSTEDTGRVWLAGKGA